MLCLRLVIFAGQRNMDWSKQMNQRPSSGYESTALSRRRSAERSKTRRVPHTSDRTSYTWCRKYVKCENALQKGERRDLTPFTVPTKFCEHDICEM